MRSDKFDVSRGVSRRDIGCACSSISGRRSSRFSSISGMSKLGSTKSWLVADSAGEA